MTGDSPPVVFALDAGATTTRAVAVDREGAVLWRGDGPGASVSRLGIDGAAGIVAGLWRKAIGEACEAVLGSAPAAIAAGFAGARTSKIQDEIARAIGEIFGSGEGYHTRAIVITHDAHIALTGAVGTDDPGCVIISGTGSVCMVRSESGETALAGGWGWPLGDEGSATWVGWRAVQMGLEAWENGEASEMTDLVIEVWDLGGAGVHDIMRTAVDAGKDPVRFAELAPGVFELASGGNPDAVALVSETGEVLGRLIQKACRRLEIQTDSPLRLSLMGGLAGARQRELEEPIRSGAGVYGRGIRMAPALMPACGGAALLGFEALGTAFRFEAHERLGKELAEQGQRC